MTVINEQQASRTQGIASQKKGDTAVARALEPVIQSALGIVRESAGLLYHITGLGIALVSGVRLRQTARTSSFSLARNVKPQPKKSNRNRT